MKFITYYSVFFRLSKQWRLWRQKGWATVTNLTLSLPNSISFLDYVLSEITYMMYKKIYCVVKIYLTQCSVSVVPIWMRRNGTQCKYMLIGASSCIRNELFTYSCKQQENCYRILIFEVNILISNECDPTWLPECEFLVKWEFAVIHTKTRLQF